MDNAIHRRNHYPEDSAVCFVFTYPLDSVIQPLNNWRLIANANQNLGFEKRRILTTGNNNVNFLIPLNRYSFFEELEDKMLVPIKLQFNLTLQNDDELIQKLDAADDGRVVLNRFLLWCQN